MRVTKGARGTYLTARLPGTGLSYRHSLDGSGANAARPSKVQSEPSQEAPERIASAPSAASTPYGFQPVQSGDASELTSYSFVELQAALQSAHVQHEEVQQALEQARAASTRATLIYKSWRKGWFLRRLFPGRYSALRSRATNDLQEVHTLEAMLEQSVIDTQFAFPLEMELAFTQVERAFAACMGSQRIWSNTAERAVDKFVERTTASLAFVLEPASFNRAYCGVIRTEAPALQLLSARGVELFIYPGFLVFVQPDGSYALVELADIVLDFARLNHQEVNEPPSDSAQVGTTWLMANKDGTRDRRFAENRQVPVMRYGLISLRTQQGLHEQFVLSDFQAASKFTQAWRDYMVAVKAARPTTGGANPAVPVDFSQVALLAAYLIEGKFDLNVRAVFGLTDEAGPDAIAAAMARRCPTAQTSDAVSGVAELVAFALSRLMSALGSLDGEKGFSLESLQALFELRLHPSPDDELEQYLQDAFALRKAVQDGNGPYAFARSAAVQAVAQYQSRQATRPTEV